MQLNTLTEKKQYIPLKYVKCVAFELRRGIFPGMTLFKLR